MNRSIDPVMIATWRSQVALADEVLADIAAGRTGRPYSAADISDIRGERERFRRLIDAARFIGGC